MNEIRQKPRAGTMWKHYNGDFCDVLAIANECSNEPERPTEVVYQSDDGKVHTWPLATWDASFCYVGQCPLWPHH